MVVVVLGLVIAVMVVPGFAATLGGLTPGRLGARGAVVAACDTNGFTVTYVTSGSTVTSATVGGIADPGCQTGVLSLTLADGATSVASGGPTTVPTDPGTVDDSVTLALSPQPPAAQVNRVHVSIEGP